MKSPLIRADYELTYREDMERAVDKAQSFAEAKAWDREQSRRMQPVERIAVARSLQKRFYGESKDVRKCQKGG